MNIKHTSVLVIAIAVIVMASCQKKTAVNQDECDKPVMYNTSELAELMRDMYADNEAIKDRILKGEWPDSFPSYFVQLHTAKATDPSDINDTYKGLADEYLKRFNELKEAPQEKRIASYNALVEGCLSCHQVFCSGPIPKIQKLKIAN